MGQGITRTGYRMYNGEAYRIDPKDVHSIPTKNSPNTVIQKFDKNGNLTKERYFSGDGKAYVDIDYTNHGNAKRHPKVPHIHKWNWNDKKNPRGGAK